VGLAADEWSEWKRFFTSPGFAEEEVTIFEATGLSEVEDHEPDPEERIEIVKWPLDDLDAAIEACHDSKSLIALYMLRAIRA
jgi:ADP-ribose pyrophosphatase